MTLYAIFVLAMVQGITEFLPISSSAHLILVRDGFVALGLPPAEGTASDLLAFDVALHVGSLGAVIAYFWRDVAEMVGGLRDGLARRGGPRLRLLLLLVVATVPVVVVGFLAQAVVTDLLRATEIIAWTTLLFALLLWAADRRPTIKQDPHALTMRDAVFVGLMQCLALVPGVSRAGICMTAGRLLGFDRPLSARFSLLLGIPTLAAAGLLASYNLYRAGDAHLTADAVLGGALAFVFSFVAVALMMSWLKRATYMPFIVYRIALGLLLLGLIYGARWSPTL